MAKTNKLPRELYKKIKQMDNVRLCDFLNSFYADGKADARNEIISAISFEELREKIGVIKGIGAARLDEIMSVVETYLTNAILEEDTESEEA